MKGEKAAAGSFNLNGQWQYNDSNSGEGDLRQNYNAAYSGDAELTDLIGISGNLRYSKNIAEDSSRDYLSPGFTLDNKNDIYNFSIFGNYAFQKSSNDDSDDEQSETWNWTSTLSSSWQNPLYPKVTVSYGQRGSSRNSDKGATEDSASGRTAWNYLEWLNIFYSIDWFRKSAPGIDAVVQDDVTQRAGLEAGQFFFDSRLRLNLNLNYRNTKNTLSGQPGEGGFILLPLLVTDALYEETNEPLTGDLTNDASFLLTDEIPPLTLVINPLNDPMNIGFRVDFQRVDLIYLTALNDIDEFAASFSWDLYSSNNGFDWTLEQASLPFDYDVSEQRFEFEVDSLASQQIRWLKLVADTSSLSPLQNTEIVALEVFRKIFNETGGPTITEEISRDNYQAVFDLSYQLKENMRFNYGFSYNEQESSLDQGNRTLISLAGLSWTPGRYFSGRINASDTRETIQGGLDTNNRTYGLSLGSAPLDTLDFSLGAAVTERYVESALLQHFAAYSFVTTARLYTDLNGSLDFGYTQGLLTSADDSFSETLRLTARLQPTLVLYLDQRFSRDIEANRDSHKTNANLNWGISDILNLNNNLSFSWGDDAETKIANNLGLTIAANKKNRLNFNYGFVDAGAVNHIYSASWNWLINPLAKFLLSANYLISEIGEDAWGVQARLSYFYGSGY
jgi:hypothetical protein